MYARKRKPKRQKPEKRSAETSAAYLPYNIRAATVIADRTKLNAVTFFHMGVQEAADWLQDHTPDDVKGCEKAFDAIESNSAACARAWQKFPDETVNKNRTLMMRYFAHPALAQYREKLKNKVRMRAVKNHRKKPYLIGWCCLLYISARMLSATLRQSAERLGEELRLNGIDINTARLVVKDLDTEAQLEELLDPVSKLITHLCLQMGIDDKTFMEYMKWAEDNADDYAEVFASLRLKDMRNAVCDMVDAENRLKK